MSEAENLAPLAGKAYCLLLELNPELTEECGVVFVGNVSSP